ncbi:MAG: hypothetical protein QFC78_00500 [Pseudomonadota bacterium]|nr:hypothetical protein [Pseudomonadota bacterium]
MLAITLLLLAASLAQQFRVIGSRGQLLDALTFVPQWKFFGQSRIGYDPSVFDDLCLVVRVSPASGAMGPWECLLSWDDRPLSTAFWNPSKRRRDGLAIAMLELILARAEPKPSARSYLTLLRHCLDHIALAEGETLQFAVVTTFGRSQRAISLPFLSAWHTP